MKNRRRLTKAIFYIIVLVIPLVFWYTGGGGLSFETLQLFLASLARGAGIVGITFFAGNLLLSGRYTFFNKAFGGLDKVYLFHRKMGITAFCLLCSHVFLVSINALMYSWAAFKYTWFDFSPANYALTFGRITFIAFFIIILLTLYFGKKMKYEWLKNIHKWLGALLFFGGIHAYFIGSEISFMLALKYYSFTLIALGIISYLVRTVLAKWLVKRIVADVTAVHDLGGSVTEVIMQPRGGKIISFIPGQFIFVKFQQAGFPKEDHPFSLTASTEEGRLRISAKGVGDFTRALPQLKAGAIARIQGPYGGFSYKNAEHKKQIWIAGGIGITPFMSMARTFRDRISKMPESDTELSSYDITLFYSGQTQADLVYAQELLEIAREVPNMKLVLWNTQKQGYINVDAMSKESQPVGSSIFICGPQLMLTAMRDAFKAKGVKGSDIHFELFKLL